MKIKKLFLDLEVATTYHGDLYGLDYVIKEKTFTLKIYIDLFSRRIKVQDYSGKDFHAMTTRLEKIAAKNGLDKIFIKARTEDWINFLKYGYILEGVFKYFYDGEDAYCVSRFLNIDRLHSKNYEEANRILLLATEVQSEYKYQPLTDGFVIRTAIEEDIDQIAELYKGIFRTYPVPLNDPSYLRTLMRADYLFMVVEHNGEIVSCASADMNIKYRNAEITDCASNPKFQGKGLMTSLIYQLEKEIEKLGIRCVYSLARALSPGMNVVFKKLGYLYTGRLVNNCNIAGSFEDINLWVKKLS